MSIEPLTRSEILQSKQRLLDEGFTEDRVAVRVHDELLKVLGERNADPDRHLDRSPSQNNEKLLAAAIKDRVAWYSSAGPLILDGINYVNYANGYNAAVAAMEGNDGF